MRNRRAFLTAAGTATLGLTALLPGSDPARAQVSMSLDIPAETWQTSDGEVPTPYIEVQASYEYDALSTPTEVVVSLLVGETEIDSGRLTNVPTSDSASLPLSGAVTDAAMFDGSDFAVSMGQTQTVTIPVTLRCEVRDDAGVMVEAETSQDVPLELQNTSDGTVAVGGTGDILKGAP